MFINIIASDSIWLHEDLDIFIYKYSYFEYTGWGEGNQLTQSG